MALESIQRAYDIGKNLLKEEKSKDMNVLKSNISEIVIIYYSIYDRQKKYEEAHKILDEYLELSKEMYKEESTQYA